MSHFKIIQLSETPINKSEGNEMSEYDINDDPLLNMNSDGWEEENYPHTLEDVKSILTELGKVNKRKKTFTFISKEALRGKYIRSMLSVFDNWKKKMEAGKNTMAEYQLRTGVREACGVDALFYYDDYLHSASGLIADYLGGYLPEKLNIGTIFDCHC